MTLEEMRKIDEMFEKSMIERYGKHIPQIHLIFSIMLQAAYDGDLTYLSEHSQCFQAHCKLALFEPVATAAYFEGLAIAP